MTRAIRPVIASFRGYSHHIYLPIAWLVTGLSVFILLLLGARLGAEAPDAAETGDATPRVLGNVLLWQAVCVAPLFVVGEDYGRWIFLWSASSLALLGAGHARHFPETGLWTRRWLRRLVERMVAYRALLPFVLLVFAVPVVQWKVETYAAKTPARFLAQLVRFSIGQGPFFETAYRCKPWYRCAKTSPGPGQRGRGGPIPALRFAQAVPAPLANSRGSMPADSNARSQRSSDATS